MAKRKRKSTSNLWADDPPFDSTVLCPRKDCPVEHITLHFVAFKPAVFEVANVVLDLCCPWCGGQLENLEGMYDGQDAARLLSTAGKVAPGIKPPGPTQRRKD